MKINNQNILECEPGDIWECRFEPSPNKKPGLQPAELLLTATGRGSVDNAVENYQKPGKGSVHLVLGKDGVELVQLVPFNQRTQNTSALERTSVVVALDYYPSSKNADDADPTSYLVDIAGNNKPYHVAYFPKEQLDSMLELCVFLGEELTLDTFLSNAEVNVGSAYPGPAFPITLFRERLFERTNGKLGSKIVLEAVAESAVLRNAPDPQGTSLTAEPLPVGTPVSIISDYKGWVRVEVMQPVDDNRWLVGWLEETRVQSGTFTPVVQGNRLCTSDGRYYRFIPAYIGNFEANKEMVPQDVEFVIMHITTGTRMQSTINHFQSSSSGVSAHLVIGRDGRVVQMVPFDRPAYHAGSGSWEGQDQINRRSIGIEIDNAGQLAQKIDQTYTRRTTVIPEAEVEWIQHWKARRERPWHRFTPIQLDVTQAVVKALVEGLLVRDLLEHERISLVNRSDPGPLYPMDQLRQDILGNPLPEFVTYQVVRETALYENVCYDPPNLDVETYPGQLPPCTVKVLEDRCMYWTLIEVVKCEPKNREGKKGWVRTRDVTYFRDQLYNMKRQQDFYKQDGGKKKPPSWVLMNLPPGTKVRVQKKTSSSWSLVSTPEHTPDYLFLEGWLRTEDIEKVG